MSPAGFARHRAGASWVWLRNDIAEPLRAVGLADPAIWDSLLAEAPRGEVGRGAVARLALPGAASNLVVKRLERGGWLAPLWRGRFAGISRLLANLSVPEAAARLGLATARAAALLAIPGPPGFWRGRLAVEEIAGAEDLATRLRRQPLDAAEADAVAAALRAMHDAGLEHRDLNLGNVLVRPTPAGPEAFVVDLDGARWTGGPLSFGERQAALRRLERSCERVLGRRTGAAAADDLYAAYPGDDVRLAERLTRGRARGRRLLALRRPGRTTRGGYR